MPFQKPLAAALILIGVATPTLAADFSDPTWPCVQRKVEQLSMGLMWSFPVDTDVAAKDEAVEQDVALLAEKLALRRIELDDASADVDAFAERHDGSAQILGKVFAKVFESLSGRRTRIIEGIETFSLGQIALAEKIDAKRLEMDRLMATDEPDFDQVDALEEQLDWDQVIHSDRQRSITHLCETPVLLERRLFAVAQMLQAVVQREG